jgi:hypothetical protein
MNTIAKPLVSGPFELKLKVAKPVLARNNYLKNGNSFNQSYTTACKKKFITDSRMLLVPAALKEKKSQLTHCTNTVLSTLQQVIRLNLNTAHVVNTRQRSAQLLVLYMSRTIHHY